MIPDAQAIRAALRCDRPSCECQRPTGNVHCLVPGHGRGRGDLNPSLAVDKQDGRALVHCLAGCSQEAVIEALRARGLWPERRHQGAERVKRYELRDVAGTLVAVHVRRDRDGGKTFAWQRPDGSSGLDGLRVADLPVYGVHLLRDRPDEPVIVCEGEKAAQVLLDAGRLAVGTVTGAAATPSVEAFRPLIDRTVILWPDNDEPGRAHMQRIAVQLQSLGVAPRVVEWPAAPPGGDAADFVNEHGAGMALDGLLAAARPFDGQQRHGLQFVRLGDLLAQPEEETPWLVDGRLPSAGLSLLAGRPKAGKSTLARCLALAVSRGEPWLGFATQQGPVLYLALEEKVAEVRRHFEAMGATDDPVFVYCARAPQEGLPLLRQAAEQHKPGLIIVDPLLRLVRVRDANDYAVVTAALEPLLALARETGAHMLTVHYLGKGDRRGGDAILGSTAIFAAVDTALILKRSEKYRTLSSIQRYGEDLEEIVLALDPETRIVTAGLARQEADEVDLASTILEYLKVCAEPVDEPAIREAVEGRRAVKVKTLRRLVEEGRVIRSGQGRKGDPYLYVLADSGFLVPNIPRELTEPETKDGGKAHSDAPNSGSHVPPERDSGSRDSGDPAEAVSKALPLLARKAAELFDATILSVRPTLSVPERPRNLAEPRRARRAQEPLGGTVEA